jgi:regulator of replication initiation timing
MTELESRIKTIQEKLQQLLKQHTALQKENARLREALNNSDGQVQEYKKNMELLKQQVDILKLGAGEMSERDKKEFEKRISSYIKEIDRAITLLSE